MEQSTAVNSPFHYPIMPLSLSVPCNPTGLLSFSQHPCLFPTMTWLSFSLSSSLSSCFSHLLQGIFCQSSAWDVQIGKRWVFMLAICLLLLWWKATQIWINYMPWKTQISGCTGLVQIWYSFAKNSLRIPLHWTCSSSYILLDCTGSIHTGQLNMFLLRLQEIRRVCYE